MSKWHSKINRMLPTRPLCLLHVKMILFTNQHTPNILLIHIFSSALDSKGKPNATNASSLIVSSNYDIYCTPVREHWFPYWWTYNILPEWNSKTERDTTNNKFEPFSVIQPPCYLFEWCCLRPSIPAIPASNCNTTAIPASNSSNHEQKRLPWLPFRDLLARCHLFGPRNLPFGIYVPWRLEQYCFVHTTMTHKGAQVEVRKRCPRIVCEIKPL